jgi:glutathione S-transferase
MTIKLYYSPASTTSLSVLMFLAESKIPFEGILVDITTGEQHQPAFQRINPRGLVPVLVDGDFVLTESSAILKYLGDKYESPFYPRDPQMRARIHERLDWVITDVARELGYNLVYPQLFAHHARPAGQDATIAWGKQKCEQYLALFDTHGVGNNKYLCGDTLTIADFFAAEQFNTGQLIGSNYSEYPNIERWFATMRSLPTWNEVHTVANGYRSMLAGKPFVAVGV